MLLRSSPYVILAHYSELDWVSIAILEHDHIRILELTPQGCVVWR
jgi:hypothetical protein